MKKRTGSRLARSRDHKRARTQRPPYIIGVIASLADLKFALTMPQPPDLFELRLDYLRNTLDVLERDVSKLHRPVIITARDPREGGANNLSLRERAELLERFLPTANYIDVELRTASRLKRLLAQARKQNIQTILSFHDFESTPMPATLRDKAVKAKSYGADIFKIATRTETPAALARLIGLVADSRVPLPISAMGIGRLGAISRLLLLSFGSVLNYGSLSKSRVEGQISTELLRSALRG